ncbi:hypothetical protein [Rhodococcus sp. HS-D2]|uniref:hypothetical protein n=1 Tax=Rhodococcus sp. HS-D2 TaxID=1384636 RepID=UPI0007D91BD9|nr:hypothetical protein [Rhodococcus sp. HS-D2]
MLIDDGKGRDVSYSLLPLLPRIGGNTGVGSGSGSGSGSGAGSGTSFTTRLVEVVLLPSRYETVTASWGPTATPGILGSDCNTGRIDDTGEGQRSAGAICSEADDSGSVAFCTREHGRSVSCSGDIEQVEPGYRGLGAGSITPDCHNRRISVPKLRIPDQDVAGPVQIDTAWLYESGDRLSDVATGDVRSDDLRVVIAGPAVEDHEFGAVSGHIAGVVDCERDLGGTTTWRDSSHPAGRHLSRT